MCSAAPVGGSRQSELEAWEKARGFLFQEANQEFREAPEDTRERRLGEAVTSLALQPRTEAKIRRAQHELQKLAEEEPSDPLGKAARFYLARILETHLDDPQPEKAREIYLELLRDGGGDPFAELAASRIALIDLYAAAGDPALLAGAVDGLFALEPLLRTDAGRREFFTNIGFTLVDLGGDPKAAMECLIRADQIGQPLPAVDADALLVIGALAERLGELSVARSYYQKFAGKYRRDNRRHSVEQMIDALPGPESM